MPEALSISARAKPPPAPPLDLILLSVVAGSSDAAGYLALGKVFTANMTGNVVLLGIALGEGRLADSGRSLFSLFCFVIGTCVGGWLTNRVPRKTPWTSLVTEAIVLEAALLLAYAIFAALVPGGHQIDYAYPLIALLGFAMGVQSAAAVRLGIPGVVTTVVTGTITSVLTGMMKLLHVVPTEKSEKAPQGSSLRLQAFVVLTYCLGAAISGLLFVRAPAWGGFFPTSVIIAVVIARLTR